MVRYFRNFNEMLNHWCARALVTFHFSRTDFRHFRSGTLKFHTDCFFSKHQRVRERRLPMNKFWCHYHFNRSISLKFGDVCKQKICSSGVLAHRARRADLSLQSEGYVTRLQRGWNLSSLSYRIQPPLFASSSSSLCSREWNDTLRLTRAKEYGIAYQGNARDAFACCNIYINNDWQNNIWRERNADGVGRACTNKFERILHFIRSSQEIPPGGKRQAERMIIRPFLSLTTATAALRLCLTVKWS